MFLVYNLLLVLLSPFWVPWMIVRARRRSVGPNWPQRFGDYSKIQIPKDQPAIWIHAVSVGEVMAVLPILRQVRALLPGHHIVLSVTTSSGHHTAQEHAMEMVNSLVYFPVDVPRFQLNAMMRIRPDVVAIMETELWFNFLWSAKSLGARTLLINGRISDRSFRRSRWIRLFYRSLLGQMDECLMQTEQDRDRILALGARSAEVVGNCKFDQAVDGLDADPEWWRDSLGLPSGKSVIVVGSTRGAEEEAFVLSALQPLQDQVSIVWAPRHLERADALEASIHSALGECARRSRSERGRVVLLDTYGELAKVYAVADIVIIGGGFGDFGGQNLLQPLAHGKPVIHGRHMQNFRDVAASAGQAGATLVCGDPLELQEGIKALLENPDRARAMGARGREFVESNAGASRRYALAIEAASLE